MVHRAEQIAGGEVAQDAQRLGHLLGGPGGMAAAAEPALDAADRLGIEQPAASGDWSSESSKSSSTAGPADRRSPRRGSSHW